MSEARFEQIEPALLWEHFRELSAVPRPPRGEEAALALLRDWAGALGLSVVPAGGSNLLVRVPATTGRDGAPTLVLQAHVDMVCERDAGSPRDAARDGVRLVVDGDWVTAAGTSLGADNGIGVAAMQAVAESEAPHGPLELLFTTAEEVGLEGAGMLDGAVVTGRRLLNLDGQEDGVMTVGCAGATDSTLRLHAERTPAEPGETALEVHVAGAAGGHSGMDVAAGRANAIKLLGRVLGEARDSSRFRLASLEGGRSRNAIPREASAVLLTRREDCGAVRSGLKTASLDAMAAYATGEPDLRVLIEEAAAPASAWSYSASALLIDALRTVPSGPLALDPRLAGQVETSTSLGTAMSYGDVLELHSLTRTSNQAALGEVLGTLAAVAHLCGGELTVEHGYPAWEPRPDSPLLAACAAVWHDLFGGAPLVMAAHAGLEPALLGRAVPGMDMLSVGPLIESPHSPLERVSVSSVRRFWRFLTAALDALSV